VIEGPFSAGLGGFPSALRGYQSGQGASTQSREGGGGGGERLFDQLVAVL
jgi:hypothetical protein